MKNVLFVLVVAGIAVCGCAGGPSGSSGQIKPSVDGFTPGEYQTVDVDGYKSKAVQATYKDGTITVLTIGNIPIRVSPMTRGGSRGRKAPDSKSNEEFDKMIKQYEANLAANPQDYDSCIMLASLYIEQKQEGSGDIAVDKAVEYVNKALAIRKDDVDALYVRGIAYREKADSNSMDNALKDFREVIQRDFKRVKGIYYLMGTIYYEAKKYDEAITVLEKVRAIEPGFADTDELLEALYKKI